MRGPRALLAVGAAAVVPLALSTGLVSGPAPLSGQVVSSVPAGQVLLVGDPQHPGQLVLQGDRTPVPVRVAVVRAGVPLGGPAEVTLAVGGLLVLAGAATCACAGGSRVRAA